MCAPRKQCRCKQSSPPNSKLASLKMDVQRQGNLPPPIDNQSLQLGF